MNMTIHNGGEQPIYAQIKAQIKEQILSGVLREGGDAAFYADAGARAAHQRDHNKTCL